MTRRKKDRTEKKRYRSPSPSASDDEEILEHRVLLEIVKKCRSFDQLLHNRILYEYGVFHDAMPYLKELWKAKAERQLKKQEASKAAP